MITTDVVGGAFRDRFVLAAPAAWTTAPACGADCLHSARPKRTPLGRTLPNPG